MKISKHKPIKIELTVAQAAAIHQYMNNSTVHGFDGTYIFSDSEEAAIREFAELLNTFFGA